MIRAGKLFENGSVKSVVNDTHATAKSNITTVKEELDALKRQLNTEIRRAFDDEKMSGSYAKAFDNECTEIMQDIDKLVALYDQAEQMIQSKLSEIEGIELEDEINLSTCSSYVVGGLCPPRTDREIITDGTIKPVEQQIVMTEQTYKGTRYNTANRILQNSNTTVLEETFPGLNVSVSGRNAKSFKLINIHGVVDYYSG